MNRLRGGVGRYKSENRSAKSVWNSSRSDLDKQDNFTGGRPQESINLQGHLSGWPKARD